MGVYLYDISSFDQPNGIFDVDAEVWVKWRGEFNPGQIQISNAANITTDYLGSESDGDWNSTRWRIRGTLRGEFPAHRFPFDEQTLAVVLELSEHDGQILPDLAGSGMARSFSITDWLYEPEFRLNRSQEMFRSDLGSLAIEGQPAMVNRVGFEVVMVRPISPVTLKLFLPLTLVAIMVLSSLFLDPREVDTRVALGVTGLVACIAFQFSLSDILPNVAYMTLADWLFIVVYVISMLCVLISAATHGMVLRGRDQQALWFDRAWRVIVVIGSVIVVWNAIPDPVPGQVIEPEPLPQMERHASVRDTVRIGTNMEIRASVGPVATASLWPLVYRDPNGVPQPLFVERAPGIDNEALRFIAGGEVETTWRLREGLKWSDGKPVRADDIMLWYKIAPDANIVEATKIDHRTVMLRWDDRLSKVLEPPGFWASHLFGEMFESEGYEAVLTYIRENGTPSLGPYRLVSIEENRLVAEANPYFMGPAPNIGRVEVIGYADRDALFGAFKNGEVDITIPNGVTAAHLDELRQSRPEAVHQTPSSIFTFMHPDLEDPLLSHPEVRRAIIEAIDRGRLAREIYGSEDFVAHVPVPGTPPRGTDLIGYDPESARQILEEAGALGAVIPLTYAASNPQVFIDGIAADLEAVGLRVELNPIPNTMALWRDGGHKGLLIHILRGSREGAPQRWWNLRAIDGQYRPSMRNVAYTDQIHVLVEREARALYVERREQLRDALFAEWSQRLPGMPLIFTDERILVDPNLRGWERDPQSTFGQGLERWYFVGEEEEEEF